MSSAFGINFRYRSQSAKTAKIEAQGNICPICGKTLRIEQITTTEHIFPRAIAKWGFLTEEEKSKCIALLNSRSNTILVHEACNTGKGMRLPKLDELYLSDEHREQLYELNKELEPYIQKFSTNLLNVVGSLDQKCAVCNKFVKLSDITLRRKDSNIARSIENTAIVHCWCNQKYRRHKKQY